MNGFRLGTTLFALTNEWLSRRYTFETLLDEVAELGLGPGLELIGFQSIRGYPNVDREFEHTFKRLVVRHGFEPSSLGGNIDFARRVDRVLTPDEVLETIEAQIEAARRLGFPVLRIQKVDDALFERAAALAERANVKLGIEIHAPLHVDHPVIVQMRELFDRIDSPYLGFIPDWSATMTDVPVGQLEAFQRNGLAPQLTDFLRELWHRGGPPNELFDEFAERARAEGATPAAINQVPIVFSMFAHNDPQRWLEILPQAVHVHAKFYELEADGTDRSIPHAELVSVLLDGGYRGFVSSEWEAHAWADLKDADGFEMIRRHQELCRRLLAAPVA